MFDTVVLDGELNLILQNDADCSLNVMMDGDLGVVVETGRLPVYDGATELTPSAETQVLQTNQYALRSNIVVNPIPSNYGLITWNGSTLTVS